MNEMNSIQMKLNAARTELLDLGSRNPLINYRLSKARGVEIVDESPPDIYRILVQDGKAMSFLPKPEPEEDDNFQLFEDDEMEKDPARYTDSKLQTDYSSVEFQKRLLNTYYTARTAIEEQGVNTLYLVLGMLQWYESESSNILRRAPLILIPVEISRTRCPCQLPYSLYRGGYRGQISPFRRNLNLNLASNSQTFLMRMILSSLIFRAIIKK